ncbi:hypothetical protein NQ315_012465 [Exocentrus adspersus]|uniref:CCHC-type domain-containing protein n=1 Tax=Exocentrus adspersus TaxID=1586481 RepID=A0AAV8VNL3_9CUCU|nr:hypothetical protein NQ315_012465 [Exocentrus adspersus]
MLLNLTAIQSTGPKRANELDTLLQAEQRNASEIDVCLQLLQSKYEELLVMDNKIREELLAECGEEGLSAEITACDEYKHRLLQLRSKCSTVVDDIDSTSSSTFSRTRRKFKLPRIELKKFNDDIKDWLPFWAQFKKIHDDVDIDRSDKIAYLSQATVPGSRARRIVDSFPPVPENYKKIVDCLCSPFGREDLQIEVYVRELLRLVLNRASSGNCSVSVLYDEIESQLWSLETLGITSDKYAAMLYPLIESCLPENLIRVYQRFAGRFADSGGASVDGEDSIEKGRVDNEQKFALAAERFGINEPEIMAFDERISKSKKPVEAVSTAADLINCGFAKCVFCGGSHDNHSCFKAQKMNLDQKRDLLSRGKACFRCLKLGHSSRRCHSKVKYIVCGKSHVTLMCCELPINKGKKPQEEPVEGSTDQVLASQTNTPVFLETLRVNLVGKSATKQVRALVDTGSQNSYILQSTARKLGLESLKEERIVHALFGGRSTSEQRHNCYRVEVSGEEFNCSKEALDQSCLDPSLKTGPGARGNRYSDVKVTRNTASPTKYVTICKQIPHVTDGPWLEELKAMNIALTDVVDSGPIEILCGADVIGKLYTGCKHELNCGLFVIETLFGWTLMGRIPLKYPRCDAVMTVFSLFATEVKLTDLGEPSVLGITDPEENKPKQQKANETKEFFEETTRMEEAKMDPRRWEFSNCCSVTKTAPVLGLVWNDIMLLGSDNAKRINWPLGRITEVLPGKDDQTRLVRVQTTGGQLLRPIQRLYPLECIEASPQSSDATSSSPDTPSCSKGKTRIKGSDSAVVNDSRAPDAESGSAGERRDRVPNKPGDNVVIEKRTRRGRLIKLPSRFKE